MSRGDRGWMSEAASRDGVRYLLGDMSDPDRERFEQVFFTDRERFDELVAIEERLIDEYLHGELPADLRDRFEAQYLASPERRQKVETARALAEAVRHLPEGSARPAAVPQPARWSRPRIAWALAASVLLITSLGLAVRLRQLADESAALRARLQVANDTAEQLADQRRQTQDTLDALRAERDRLRAALDRGSPSTAPAVFSLVVPVGLTRSGTPRPAAALPAEPVAFRLLLDVSALAEGPFDVILRDPRGATVARWDRVAPGSEPGGGSRLALPPLTAVFATGEYEVEVRESPDPAPVAYGYFAVE